MIALLLVAAAGAGAALLFQRLVAKWKAVAGERVLVELPPSARRDTPPPSPIQQALDLQEEDDDDNEPFVLEPLRVKFNPTRQEQEYEPNVPVEDSLQQPATVNSVNGQRAQNEYSGDDLALVKTTRENRPKVNSLRLSSGSKINNLKNFRATDGTPFEYLPNLHGLMYGFDSLGAPEKVVFAGAADDKVVMGALSHHLLGEEFENTTDAVKRKALETFYKRYIFGSAWTTFKRRNRASLDNLVKFLGLPNDEEDDEHETVASGNAQAERTGFEHLGVGQLATVVGSAIEQLATLNDLQRNDNNANLTALRTDYNDHLAALRADQEKQNQRHDAFLNRILEENNNNNQRTRESHSNDLKLVTKMYIRSQSAPRGRLQSESSIESTFSSPSTVSSSPSSQGSPLEQRRARVPVAPATERKQRTVQTPSKKTSIRNAATERKAKAPKAILSETPVQQKKATTKSAVSSTRKAPPPSKQQVVVRELNPGYGLPQKKNGGDCGHCTKAWESKFLFCTHQGHMNLLEEYTHVVEE